jgi:hypothetical protein
MNTALAWELVSRRRTSSMRHYTDQDRSQLKYSSFFQPDPSKQLSKLRSSFAGATFNYMNSILGSGVIGVYENEQ